MMKQKTNNHENMMQDGSDGTGTRWMGNMNMICDLKTKQVKRDRKMADGIYCWTCVSLNKSVGGR